MDDVKTNSKPLLVSVDRRVTLRWFAAFAAAPLAACGQTVNAARWSSLKPIAAPTIGRDPNLKAPKAPWPLTMTQQELLTCAALSDVILPAEAGAPAASALGVPAFINEWVSAPYPIQQGHRDLIVPGLAWLDEQAQARGGATFDAASPDVRLAIVEPIAFAGRATKADEKPAAFFARMRALVLGAYYTTPEGWKQIGYKGNTPSFGPYAGPPPEAVAHMQRLVESMGLSFA